MAYETGKENEFMAELGKRISTLRKKNGLTQEELASRLGISPQAVSKWENDISCPDIMLLPELASILGVSVDELLSGSAPRTENVKPTEQDNPEQDNPGQDNPEQDNPGQDNPGQDNPGQDGESADEPEDEPKEKFRLKHIRVIVTKADGKVTDIAVPMFVVSFGLNLGKVFGGIGEGHVKQVTDAIDSGLRGEVVNVNADNGDNVRIVLE